MHFSIIEEPLYFKETLNFIELAFVYEDKALESYSLNSDLHNNVDLDYEPILNYHKAVIGRFIKEIKDQQQLRNLCQPIYSEDYMGPTSWLKEIQKYLKLFDIKSLSVEAWRKVWAEDIWQIENDVGLFSQKIQAKRPSLEDVISILNKWEIPEESKWEVIKILADPTFADLLLEDLKRLQAIVEEEFLKIQSIYQVQLDKLKNFDLEKLFAEGLSQLLGPEILYKIKVSPAIYVNLDTSYIMSLAIEDITSLGGIYVSLGLLFLDAMVVSRDLEHIRNVLYNQCKALGEKTRFNIVLELLKGPKYVKELATILDLSSPTLIHHLQALVSADLLTVDVVENKTYYGVDRASVRNLGQSLMDLAEESTEA
jgi:DNA-binding transcriptional ArsR family regulator